MEININPGANCVQANAVDIIKKFKSVQDRINFCTEKNWFHPREPGYDSTFFLLVLGGKKKYLPCNFAVNYKIRYFRSGEKLDKKYIISKMANNPAYEQYTPDHINPEKYSKSFLLNLVAFIDPPLYKSFYIIQKKQLLNKTFNIWNNYKVEIQNNLLNDIDNFCSINPNGTKQSGFRKNKNGVSTGVFHINENNIENQDNNQQQFERGNINAQRLNVININPIRRENDLIPNEGNNIDE